MISNGIVTERADVPTQNARGEARLRALDLPQVTAAFAVLEAAHLLQLNGLLNKKMYLYPI